MNAVGTIDDREFQRALPAYAAQSSRTFQQITIDASLDIAHKAIQNTKKADADKIAWELGQIGTKVSVGKDGQMKARGKLFADDSLAARIINARLRNKGEPMLFGAKLKSAVRKIIASRRKSVAFIKSGWLASVRELSRFSSSAKVRGDARSRDAQIRGEVKGFAKPAKKSFDPVTIIGNTALHNEQGAKSIGIVGLNKAFAIKVRDMRAHVLSKMRPDAQKFSAK